MELDNLSGLEFEEFIYEILIKLDFRANIMKSTGDGGIDIEAYYDGMLFKGKYLIQCKRWSSKVGEPVLRDLYGTIISNKALKGILITTNYFTRQAKEFCVGKNIELINRDQLKDLIKILQEEKINIKKTPILSQDKIGFLNNPHFNKKSYELLKYRIEDNPKLESTQKSLILQLSNSLFYMGEEAIENGLFKEFMSRAKAYRDLFCSGKTNEARGKKICVSFLMAQACIASGDLEQAYEYLLDSDESDSLKRVLPDIDYYWNIAYYLIFFLVGLENSRKETYQSSIKGYNRYIDSVDVNNIAFNHGKRIHYEIILFEQGDLTELEFNIPWITDFNISLRHGHFNNFESKPITLTEYRKKFYKDNLYFESKKEVIQSYGIHSS